jgi:carbonic anhydrase
MAKLIKILSEKDVPARYKNTPVGKLLLYQNTDIPFEKVDAAQLLIGMCMDNRKHLRIPENFAYIIRSGGANLRHSEFKISYAVSVGGVRTIALIAHNQCGMVNLVARKELFIRGLVENAGWEREKAEEHFSQMAVMFEIGNEIDFVVGEARRLKARYPRLDVVPLYYKVEDNLLYVIEE